MPRLGGVLAVPRAHLHASSTGRASFLRNAVSSTLLYVGLPDFISVEHDLRAERNRVAGTLASTLAALRAKVLQSEIDWVIDLHRQIRSNDDGLGSGPDKGVQYRIPNSGYLAEPSEQNRPIVDDLGMCVGVASG